MLSENDHDLYQWVTGQNAAPERFSVMIARVATTLHKIE
jgi:antitoxin CptB